MAKMSKRTALLASISMCPLLELDEEQNLALQKIGTDNLDVINDSLTALSLLLIDGKPVAIREYNRNKAIQFNILSKYEVCDMSQ